MAQIDIEANHAAPAIEDALLRELNDKVPGPALYNGSESRLVGLDTREMLDVAYVRRRKSAAQVSDEDALTAFSDGRGVFDVDLHCRKLDAIVAKHELEADIYTEDLLPCANPEIGNRPVYFARARWRKRSRPRPDNVA